MKSILNTQKGVCYLCGRHTCTERHHVFGGACRSLSENYGLTVDLCHECHNEPPDGVHFNAEKNLALKAKAQRAAMRVYGWTVERFRALFRKNYL